MIIRSHPTSAFRSNGLRTVCFSCLLSTAKPARLAVTRNFSQKSTVRAVAAAESTPRLRAGYFSANGILERVRLSSRRGVGATAIPGPVSIPVDGEAAKTSAPPPSNQDLPHRRRQAARRAAKEAELVLPQNSSSNLSTAAASAPSNSLRRLISVLLSLSKPRLSVLVVLTACASYSLYPVPELLLPSATATPSLSPLTFLFLTTGTTLCAASANAFNMLYEPKWDAMMSRTRNRPLVRGLISTKGAALFAALAGIGGTAALYFGVNPTVSFLGALNIYKNAGYRMLCWVNPARNGRVALRYSLLFFPICIGLCYFNVTEWTFAVASAPVNIYLLREAVRFWKLEGHKGSARGLFWASVWHLPVVMILAMVEKKGMWQRVWSAVMGEPALEDEDWIEEDEDEAVLRAGKGSVSPEARRAVIAAPVGAR
ncbi:hypothetical protein BUE80_DR010741 [Diplocarpon rosae]|nr:hypothetical protein BUE80_DR010741 [Diplocarpon rosae]